MAGRPAVATQALSKLERFKARAKAEEYRRTTVTDSEYWVALCFETREQKEEFLRKLNLLDEGDKYIDGLRAAEAMGLTIESPRFAFTR